MVDESILQDYTHEVVQAGDGVRFAARQSGLYVSRDGGQTWGLAYESLGLMEDLPTMAAAVSPHYERDGLVFAGVAGGIMRSQDGGERWQLVQFHAPPPLATALAVSPNFEEDGIVLAGTLEDGVYRSQDQGRTWKAWNFGLLDWRVLAMVISPDFGKDRRVYIGTESGLFVSENQGRSWRALPFGDGPAAVVGIRIGEGGRIELETDEDGWFWYEEGEEGGK